MKKLCILLLFIIMLFLTSCGSGTQKELILPEAESDEIFAILDDTEKTDTKTEKQDIEAPVADVGIKEKEVKPEQTLANEKKATAQTTVSTLESTSMQKSESTVADSEINSDFDKNAVNSEKITAEPEKNTLICTLEIKCDNALKSTKLSDEKRAHLPADGIILAKCEVEFSDGESVFDVLLRETQARKIHFEFSKTPAYNSAYIEGIANLYEFDCGDLSGWNYAVNGALPRAGCSQYKVKSGDSIVWTYTCDYTTASEG